MKSVFETVIATMVKPEEPLVVLRDRVHGNLSWHCNPHFYLEVGFYLR